MHNFIKYVPFHSFILIFLSSFLIEKNVQAQDLTTAPPQLKYFGYFQSDWDQELQLTHSYTNLVMFGGAITPQRLSLARQLKQKLFLTLEDIFFERRSDGKSYVFSKEIRDSNWASILPLLRSYNDIIEAYVPVDEPEFRVMGDRTSTEPRDTLEDMAVTIRKDFPNAKLAINFWYETILNTRLLLNHLPRNYNYVGTEAYDGDFSPDIYNIIENLTSEMNPQPNIYLVPKAFIATSEDPILSWIPEVFQKFYQPEGESGLIQRHLEKSVQYAYQHPRVTVIVPFMWRSFPERGQILHGANELPKVRAWIQNFGLNFLKKLGAPQPPNNPPVLPPPVVTPPPVVVPPPVVTPPPVVVPPPVVTPSPKISPSPTSIPGSKLPSPTSCSGWFKSGESLSKNEYRCSINKNFLLIMQENGSLEFVQLDIQSVLWSSKTNGTGVKATFQSDGNLVILDVLSRPIWSSKTAGNPGAKLFIGNEGLLIMYDANNMFISFSLL